MECQNPTSETSLSGGEEHKFILISGRSGGGVFESDWLHTLTCRPAEGSKTPLRIHKQAFKRQPARRWLVCFPQKEPHERRMRCSGCRASACLPGQIHLWPIVFFLMSVCHPRHFVGFLFFIMLIDTLCRGCAHREERREIIIIISFLVCAKAFLFLQTRRPNFGRRTVGIVLATLCIC
jgi:hypothetical protein